MIIIVDQCDKLCFTCIRKYLLLNRVLQKTRISSFSLGISYICVLSLLKGDRHCQNLAMAKILKILQSQLKGKKLLKIQNFNNGSSDDSLHRNQRQWYHWKARAI